MPNYFDHLCFQVASQLRSTYVDGGHCYKVAWSVGLSRTVVMSPAKMAAPIEMPFGLRTWVGPSNRALDGVQIPHRKGQYWGKRRPTVKYKDALQ